MSEAAAAAMTGTPAGVTGRAPSRCPLQALRPRWLAGLAPSLLTALVATATLAKGQALGLDARAVGVAVAGLALVFRAPTLVVVVLAAAATAAGRFLGWH